ncbi:MAG: endonuclease NucS domain-containing protein, partial [Thermodesulfobacteriota bacterium]
RSFLMKEKEIQKLLCYHPYLLDLTFAEPGAMEVVVTTGRLDIALKTSSGLVIVEVKKKPLKNAHIEQILRYLRELDESGIVATCGFLVGQYPIKSLSPELLELDSRITIKYLIKDIPLYLSMCEEGHYFDHELNRCPICNCRPRQGGDLLLR